MNIFSKLTKEQLAEVEKIVKFPTRRRFKDKTVLSSPSLYGYYILLDEKPDVLLPTLTARRGFLMVEPEKFFEHLKDFAKESVGRWTTDSVSSIESRDSNDENTLRTLVFQTCDLKVIVKYAAKYESLIPRILPRTKEELSVYIEEAERVPGAIVSVNEKLHNIDFGDGEELINCFLRHVQITVEEQLRHGPDMTTVKFPFNGETKELALNVPNVLKQLDPELKSVIEIIDREIANYVKFHNIDINDNDSLRGFLTAFTVN